MSDKFETQHTDNPTCPFCGHAERDAWEIDFGPGIEGDTTVSCGECGEDYKASRGAIIFYHTRKLTKETK
jgi:transcription elongation factor Elf1